MNIEGFGLNECDRATVLEFMAQFELSENRSGIISAISNNFCLHCGSDDLPCHCMNDE